jgi:hypothetical protein
VKSAFLSSWQVWALLSAAFAALAAIFAKVGGRTSALTSPLSSAPSSSCWPGVVLSVTEEWQSPSSVSGRSYAFLMAGTESKPSDAASVRRNLSLIGDHCSLRGRHLPPHDGVGNAGLVMSHTRLI